MKYKQAVAAVFQKYRNPRTRSSALALLERYASATRPVTAWHALGEDAEAARLVLETLGFREKEHFTVQTSVLDPAATRFSWTDAGVRLVAQMSREVAGMRLCEAQRRTLVKDAGDPLACVDDVELPETVGIDPGYGLVEYVLDRTLEIAKRINELGATAAVGKLSKSQMDALLWAKQQLLKGAADSVKSPVAPLCVLEALARLEDVPDLPPFPVFNAYDAELDYGGWSCTRACKTSDDIPSGRINCLPLTEQNSPCGALDGFFAWTAEEFRKFTSLGRDATWTQFDARICRTAEALNFALDAEGMRKFVVKIVEHGYGPTLKAALSGTTRLAVGNTALGGVPGNECLEDDGDTSSFQYRVEDSTFPVDAPVYMGAFAMAKALVPGNGDWSPPTHPVAIATGDNAEENAATEGLVTEEAAEEWFAVVHGADLSAHHVPFADQAWETAAARQAKRVANLVTFRQVFARLAAPTQKDRLTEMCSPTNRAFNAHDGAYSVEAAFVQGIGAAMRKYAPEGALQFCESSPYHPDKIIAGVWTGLMTDLAPSSVDEAVDADVFPNIVGFNFLSYADSRAMKENTTKLLKALRGNPWLQFKFGKRRKGTHRRHAILVETNVLARPFVEGLARAGTDGDFAQGVWRAFHTSFLTRNAAPLASVDGEFHGYGICGRSTVGLMEWVAKDVPDWTDTIATGLGDRVNTGFVDVAWREDELGRLVVMVTTTRREIATRAKLAYRYAEHLPLSTAAYLAAHGRTSTVVLDKDLSEEDRFRRVLMAAVRQPGFLHDCGGTIGTCGRFGSAWIRELVWDLDSDECPGRGWYLDGVAGVATETVGSYVRVTGHPFTDTPTPF